MSEWRLWQQGWDKNVGRRLPLYEDFQTRDEAQHKADALRAEHGEAITCCILPATSKTVRHARKVRQRKTAGATHYGQGE